MLLGAGLALHPTVSLAFRDCGPSYQTYTKFMTAQGASTIIDTNGRSLTNDEDCGTFLINPGLSYAIDAGGTSSNVIISAGSTLTVNDQGFVDGMILGGASLTPEDKRGKPPVPFGGAGTIIVKGGATVRGVAPGPGTTATIGDDSGKQATLGWIHSTGGNVTVTNAKLDSSYNLGVQGSTQTESGLALASLDIGGGTTSVSNSTINGVGYGNSAGYITGNIAGVPAATTVNISNSTITGYDTIYVDSSAGDAPITLNITDSTSKAVPDRMQTIQPAYGEGVSLVGKDDSPVNINLTRSQFSGSIGAFFQAGKNATVVATGSTFTADGDGPALVNDSLTGIGMVIRGGASVTLDQSTVDSSAAGGVQGIFFDTVPAALDNSTLQLLNGSVVNSGANSPAIEVKNTFGKPYSANILIASGSKLNAGNGVILQADERGVANVTADAVNLTGNSEVTGADSQLNIGLRNNATIQGDFSSTDGGSLTLGAADAAATFAVTGNVSADAASATVALGANGVLNGNVTGQNGSQLTVQGAGAGARLNGSVTGTGGAMNVGLSGGAQLSGPIVADGGTATVNLTSGAQAKGGLALKNGATGTQVGLDGAGTLLSNANGPAIAVDGTGTTANIYLQNGGRLDAAAGNPLVGVSNAALANVVLDNTTQSGDMMQDATGKLNVALRNNAVLSGNLASSSLLVSSGSRWNMGDQTSQSVGDLTMNGGVVAFNSGTGPFKTLNASSLSGSGTFDMAVDFKPGTGNDLLNVQGQASGQHALDVYAEDQGVQSPRNNIPVVQTGGGSARFGLVGDKIDAGIYTYSLQQSGNDWLLTRNDPEPQPPGPPGPGPGPGPQPPVDPPKPSPDDLSPAAKTTLSMSAALPYAFYGELGTLRQRQGDLRLNKTDSGVWARGYSGFHQIAESSAPSFRLNQYGGAIGTDKHFLVSSGNLYVGGFGSYSYNTLGINGGSTGRINSYGLGAYATWMGDNGWYVDSVLKANNFDNEMHVIGSSGRSARGKYSTPGFGGSVEVGKHIELGNNGFIEPYMQWAGFMARSASETMDSKFHLHYSPTKSVQGQLGMLAGTNIELRNGYIVQPYIKGAVIREFVNNNKITMNGTTFTEDMSGTRMLAGLGVATQLSRNLQVHLDADYSTGGPVDNAVNVNMGMRYAF